MRKSNWEGVRGGSEGQGGTDHVAHGVALETKLLGEVEKDVLYLFHGDWNLLVGGPSGVGVCALGTVGKGRAIGLADLRGDGGCIGGGAMAGIGGVCGGRGRTVVWVVGLVASESGGAGVRRGDLGVGVVVLADRLWIRVRVAGRAGHVKRAVVVAK
jgi:hypothetical protein